jgi:hypothetical protein
MKNLDLKDTLPILQMLGLMIAGVAGAKLLKAKAPIPVSIAQYSDALLALAGIGSALIMPKQPIVRDLATGVAFFGLTGVINQLIPDTSSIQNLLPQLSGAPGMGMIHQSALMGGPADDPGADFDFNYSEEAEDAVITEMGSKFI